MARFKRSARRKALLEDVDISRWHHNVARGAQVTADVYLRRLGAFCDSVGLSPRQIIERTEPQVRDILLDYVTSEEKRRHAGSYIRSTIKAVKSWLAHNGRSLSVPIRVHGGDSTPTLRDEQVPTPQDLHRVLLSARLPRDRVAVLLMAHAGFRPEVLGNYDGSDGLRLSDFPELQLKERRAAFARVPAMIRVRPELSKNAHGYLTWASRELCGYVESYLNERLSRGEKLGPDTDLVHPERARKRFLTAINVGDVIRGSVRRAGFPWRPYLLRAYFDTQLLLAESRGKVAHDYRVFWMGHKGTIDSRYTVNKGRLPKELLEDMRSAYRRAEQFLSTELLKADPREANALFVAAFLRDRGVPESKIAEVIDGKLDGTELEKLLRLPRARVVVSGEEAKAKLVAGWVPVHSFPDGSVVLEGPLPGLGQPRPSVKD